MRSRCCLCVCVCTSPPIVSRKRLGKNHPITATQRLGRNVTAGFCLLLHSSGLQGHGAYAAQLKGLVAEGCHYQHSCEQNGPAPVQIEVLSFTSRPLYPRGKRDLYSLHMRLGGPQSRSGRCEEKNSSPTENRNLSTSP
jgi:hypothetical protein